MESLFPLKTFFKNHVKKKRDLESHDHITSPILKEKICSTKKALSGIRSGDRVFIGTGCATPATLTMELEQQKNGLDDIKLLHFFTKGAIPHEDGQPKSQFYHKAFFVDEDMDALIDQGSGDYIPMSIAQVPKLIRNGGFPIDVALIQVSMPDQFGYVSLGVSCDITFAAVQNATTVIAEINLQMPRTLGETIISLNQIDKAIMVDRPIMEHEFPFVEPAVVEKISNYVSRIIEDGSTLQVGMGAIPSEMLKHLSGPKNLGIHSDVITDSIINLINNGMVNGQEKSIHKGQIVASYCLGTRKLYELIDRNPMFSFHPIDYVANQSIIKKNKKFVSITQAQAVDLMGQVCSDQFNGKFVEGVSAQPDFMRGAAFSKEGRPIICLASTTDDGKKSRIRPILAEGEGVTIPRSDVHYVVTECGTAYLFGKSIREKALALIEVAHPSFRPWLLKEAKRLKYLGQDQDLKCKSDGTIECHYPHKEDRKIELKDRTQIVIRPSKASDVNGLQDLFYKLPPGDVFTRFFRHVKRLSVSEAEHYCNVDYKNEMAFVVTTGDREREKIIGSSFYVLDPSTNLAEVAYMILHEWQGMGLGSALQQRMAEYAKSKGIKGFKADILSENTAMVKLAHKCSAKINSTQDRSEYHIEMLF
ncbi:MAG: GNAT family N-acetyltransferase [Desulfobacteraceae bacterium]|nr:MAG: GNAT family N-acetyltransferase [Desulfobacteraceae bacterium]